MKINTATVKYSSIVSIGEDIARIESETGDKYLKLHRGVMDVTTLDMTHIGDFCDFNHKSLQQYSGNDGYQPLIDTIKSKFNLMDHRVMVTPGGMAALDLVFNSLSESKVWISYYHWGSWNKILKTHDKNIILFNDFFLNEFRPESGIVLLCYPSNPTGYCPKLEDIKDFLVYSKKNNITVVLDLPYYYLFNDYENNLSDYFYDNVIVLSSFSKSLGLSGYRVGYVATKNEELYQTLRIRSLYKYNSISTIPQHIINVLLTQRESVRAYRTKTVEHITNNINYLNEKGLLLDDYPETPIGPFAIVKMSYDELLKYKISSVPLSKFTLKSIKYEEKFSRISVAVDHEIFVEYFNKIKK